MGLLRRLLWPPPKWDTAKDADELRQQLARVRETDREHREAFDRLLRLFDFELRRPHRDGDNNKEDAP